MKKGLVPLLSTSEHVHKLTVHMFEILLLKVLNTIFVSFSFLQMFMEISI